MRYCFRVAAINVIYLFLMELWVGLQCVLTWVNSCVNVAAISILCLFLMELRVGLQCVLTWVNSVLAFMWRLLVLCISFSWSYGLACNVCLHGLIVFLHLCGGC